MALCTGGVIPDFEAMSLQEMLPLGCGLLWGVGMQPLFERMLVVDLKLSEKIVLSSLQRGPLTVAEVAECMHITHSAASRAVDRLVHDGFVSRVENPEDRRQKQLSLTAAGQELIGQFETLLIEGMRTLVEILSPEDQERFRLLVAHLLAFQAGRLDAEASARDHHLVEVHSG